MAKCIKHLSVMDNWQCRTMITERREINEVNPAIAPEFCLEKPMSKERLSRACNLV